MKDTQRFISSYIATLVFYVLMMIGILIACVLATGCATAKPTPIAYDCPTVDLPPDPIPETRKLNSKSKPDKVMEAWVVTATDCYAWKEIVRTEVETSRAN